MIVRFVDIGGIVDQSMFKLSLGEEVIVCFVDIGGIVDHYLLKLSFHNRLF